MAVVVIMTCNSKAPASDTNTAPEVRLTPIADKNEEYKHYFEATPYGECMLGILNDAAFAQFEPGADYRVTFERVTT